MFLCLIAVYILSFFLFRWATFQVDAHPPSVITVMWFIPLLNTAFGIILGAVSLFLVLDKNRHFRGWLLRENKMPPSTYKD